MMDHKGVFSFVVIVLAVLCCVSDASFHQFRELGSLRWAPLMREMRGAFGPRIIWAPSASPWVSKRSVSAMGKRFEIMINIDQCHFDAYDIDGDGVITLDEMRVIFFDDENADDLFKALDLTTADNRVTKEEFQYMAPRTIANCETTKL